MCWACLRSDHLDLPTSQRNIRYVDDGSALLATDEGEDYSWSAPLPGDRGPVIVTYSFLEDQELPATWESPYFVTDFFSYNNTQRANFRDALEEFSRVTGIIFVETDGPAMIEAYGADGSSYGGWAQYPVATETYVGTSGLVIDSDDNFEVGSYGYFTALHEIGHAVGLKHPFEGNVRLTEEADSTRNTVMSYSQDNTPTELARLDVEALRMLYGGPINSSGWNLQVDGNTFIGRGSSRNDAMTGIGLANRIEGLDGDDTLTGRFANDVLTGGNDDDLLSGMMGEDSLLGGNGADTILGGEGVDRLFGGNGNDDLQGGGTQSWLDGTSYDLLNGGGGNDRLSDGEQSGRLLGETGRDSLFGDGGRDILFGGAANDFLFGGGSVDSLFGGEGDDSLNGGDSDDTLRGGGGDDEMAGGTDTDRIYGEAGNDHVEGLSGNDYLFGGSGRDRIEGGGGNDRLFADADGGVLLGEDGRDSLYAGPTGGLLYGGKDNDVLRGGQLGLSRLYGDAGNDTLLAGSGICEAYGGVGDDLLAGGRRSDKLYGGDGRDTVRASDGVDQVFGGTDADQLAGGASSTLYGGTGADELRGTGGTELFGGTGADDFVFGTMMAGRAVIRDFAPGVDQVLVRVGAGGPGALADVVLTTVNTGTLARLTAEVGGPVVQVLLAGVARADLTAAMFDTVDW